MIQALLVVSFIGSNAQAQSRNANWLAANNWLSFTTEPVVNMIDPPSFSVGASFSDTSGHLLVYSGNASLRAADHSPLDQQPPSWSMLSGPSVAQGSIFIPRPGNPDQAYFCTYYLGPLGPNNQRFGIIPVSLGTTGAAPAVLDTGFTWFMNEASRKRMVIPHANGVDYWFVGQPVGTNAFYAYRVTADGITEPPVISQAGTVMPVGWHFGKMIPNSAGDQFVSIMEKLNYDWNDPSPAIVEHFQFDPENGTVQNVLSIPGLRWAKGAEFSPAGRFLYIADFSTPPGSAGPQRRYLYQYDLDAPDVVASATLLHSYIPMNGADLGSDNALALAPDGKIYVVHEGMDDTLGVVQDPNAASISCDYEHAGFVSQWSWPGLHAPIKNYHDDPGFGVGIGEKGTEPSLRVLPNPASDELRFSGAPHGTASMVLRDALGRVVRMERSPCTTMDIRSLRPGPYLVELCGTRGEQLGNARFIKQ